MNKLLFIVILSFSLFFTISSNKKGLLLYKDLLKLQDQTGTCKTVFSKWIRMLLPAEYKAFYDKLVKLFGEKDVYGCSGTFETKDFQTNSYLIKSSCNQFPIKNTNITVLAFEAPKAPCADYKTASFCLAFNNQTNKFVSANEEFIKCVKQTQGKNEHFTGQPQILIDLFKKSFLLGSTGFSSNKMLKVSPIRTPSFENNKISILTHEVNSDFYITSSFNFLNLTTKVKNVSVNLVDVNFIGDVHIKLPMNSSSIENTIDSYANDDESINSLSLLSSKGEAFYGEGTGSFKVNLSQISNNLLSSINLTEIDYNIAIKEENSEKDENFLNGVYIYANNKKGNQLSSVFRMFYRKWSRIFKNLNFNPLFLSFDIYSIDFDLSVNKESTFFAFNFNNKKLIGCKIVHDNKKKVSCKINDKGFDVHFNSHTQLVEVIDPEIEDLITSYTFEEYFN